MKDEAVETDEFQRTDLKRYIPHVVVVTVVVAVLPLWLAYWLSGPSEFPFLASAVVCTAASIGLGRLGSAVWQRHRGSNDVVFDDLMLWGYFRRVINQRRVATTVRRLGLTRVQLRAHALRAGEQAQLLKSLAKALEFGDPYTHGHSQRVARHAYMVAGLLKLPRRERQRIRLAAALHDVGKVHTPRDILSKPARLTDAEFEVIKRHPVDGADMTSVLDDPELTANIRHHHERLDGTGYPDRIAGHAIPLGARIIAVADTFDAITSRRPYRPARKHKEAIDVLKKEAGAQLDPAVVRAFIAYYTGRRGIRLWVLLTAGAARLPDLSFAGLQRAVANAAVVGGVAVAVTGASLTHAPDASLHDATAQTRDRRAVTSATDPDLVPIEGASGNDSGIGLRRNKSARDHKKGKSAGRSGAGRRRDGGPTSGSASPSGGHSGAGSGGSGSGSGSSPHDSGSGPGTSASGDDDSSSGTGGGSGGSDSDSDDSGSGPETSDSGDDDSSSGTGTSGSGSSDSDSDSDGSGSGTSDDSDDDD